MNKFEKAVKDCNDSWNRFAYDLGFNSMIKAYANCGISKSPKYLKLFKKGINDAIENLKDQEFFVDDLEEDLGKYVKLANVLAINNIDYLESMSKVDKKKVR